MSTSISVSNTYTMTQQPVARTPDAGKSQPVYEQLARNENQQTQPTDLSSLVADTSADSTDSAEQPSLLDQLRDQTRNAQLVNGEAPAYQTAQPQADEKSEQAITIESTARRSAEPWSPITASQVNHYAAVANNDSHPTSPLANLSETI